MMSNEPNFSSATDLDGRPFDGQCPVCGHPEVRRALPLEYLPDIQAVTVREACRRLSIGKTTFYAIAQTGKLELFKLRGRRLVTVASLRRLVASEIEHEKRALPGRQDQP